LEGPTEKDLVTQKKGEKMLSISDTRVSREHGKILFTNSNKCTYVDLGSTRGTELNGIKMSRKVLLPGDRIRIGKSFVHYEVVGKLGGSVPEIKQGWLQKKTPWLFQSRWLNKWCVLKPGRLYYKDKPSDPVLKGIIDLNGSTTKKDDGRDFTVQTVERVFHLRAPTLKDAQDWLNSVNEARKITNSKARASTTSRASTSTRSNTVS